MSREGAFQLKSPAFAEGDAIPSRYACTGENFSPPLTIRGVPEGTASLALVMYDPDAPHGDFLHWTVWNIGPDIETFFENTVPDDVMQGINGMGNRGYTGPCPPSGTHRYIFNLYALDANVDLDGDATRDDLMQAIDNHLIAQTNLTGTFDANNSQTA